MQGKCTCGEADCWDADDYSWLSSNSGWRGTIHGCHTSIFFIHGKKIREQRHIPAGHWDIERATELLREWSRGLPNQILIWSHDTGDGDSDLWIDGIREPTAEDWQRLEECRAWQDQDDRRTYERLRRRFEAGRAD